MSDHRAELQEVRVITETEQPNAAVRVLLISMRWTASFGLTDMDVVNGIRVGLPNNPDALSNALQLGIDCIWPQAKTG